MDYLIFLVIGVLMGLFGGLLGIGGSIIMIPSLVFLYGENQHLYQASAMICNFFVGLGAVLVHRKADVLVGDVVKWLVPFAVIGIIIGVGISNSSVFAREKSYLLARLYGVFALYVVVYNLLMFRRGRGGADGFDLSRAHNSVFLTILCGVLTGMLAGLLGIGGGVVCVPLQQFFLKMPLKRAISNSAATIASISLFGAFYKNVTLGAHGIEMMESLKMAACVIPGALVGAFLGGHAMHKLPANLVRAVFIVLCILACYKLLTVSAGA
jgi:uncharacterized membrane protein YfcA